MPAKILEIRFPIAGLNKRLAYKQQPPFTSPSMMNVRPSDTFLGRDRGGSRPGLAKSLALQLGSGNPVRSLSAVTWISSGAPLTQAMAVANGAIYRETAGNWSAVGGSLTFASDIRMAPAEHLQKLYYPDRSSTPLASGTDGVVTTNNTFDSATYSDWTAVSGLNINDYVLHIYNSTGTVGTYRISAIASGSLTVLDTPANGTGLSFRIERAPKIYNPSTNAVTLWRATVGTVPQNCKIVWRWRDRILMAGDPLAPHLVSASRSGDPLDFDFSKDDELAAFALQGSQAGAIGDAITAGFAHTDDCSIVGCKQSIWIMRGDPMSGGRVMPLSETIGILDQRSWCYTPSGWLFFMSLDGLYCMPPGCGSSPMGVSRDTIPDDLLAIDASSYTVEMAYDVRDQGIHLFVTPNSGGQAGTHYWITTDTERAAGPQARFFPCQYPYNYEPLSMFSRRDSTNADSAVWFGGRDGYVRNHVSTQTTDDGTAISSYVYFGPIDLSQGSGLHEGLMKELIGTLASSSGTVSWTLHVGSTPEAAFAASAFGVSGSWATAGLNMKHRPRARGGAFCLKLASTSRWAMESIVAVIERKGVQRL